MLKLLVAHGVDLSALAAYGAKYCMFGRFGDVPVQCAMEHRESVTLAVATQLPVEGVPEMVARYTGTPYDCIL